MHSLSVQLVQYVYGCGNTYWSNRNLPVAINSKNNYCPPPAAWIPLPAANICKAPPLKGMGSGDQPFHL